LNGGFKEAEENSIHLKEDDPAAVALLVAFLYRGVIPGTSTKGSMFIKPTARSSIPKVDVPKAELINGTTHYPFTAAQTTDGHVFQHICFQQHPQYDMFSQEELRVADYKLNSNHRSMFANANLAPGAYNGHASHRAPVHGVVTPTTTHQLPRAGLLFGPISSAGVNPSAVRNPPPSLGIGSVGGQPQSTGTLFGPLEPREGTTPPINNVATRLRVALASAQRTDGHTANQGGQANTTPPSDSLDRLNLGDTQIPNRPLFGPNRAYDLNNPATVVAATRESRVDFPSASEEQSLQPGGFGSVRSIKYPTPAGQFLKGIPRSQPLDSTLPAAEEHQLALLRLCLLAEKILWRALFDAAIDGYIRGDLALLRPIPFEHVDSIYDRSFQESTLRRYVLENMCANPEQDTSVYLPLAKKYDDFMEDVMNSLTGLRAEKPLVWDDETIRGFYMDCNDAKESDDKDRVFPDDEDSDSGISEGRN
jgi:hypothetical protein